MNRRPKPIAPLLGPAPGAQTVTAALRFATAAHAGQLRKDRRTPYIAHPVAVMRVLSSSLGVADPEILSAALLHDVVEDTSRSAAEIRARFGPRVARWVRELSIPPEFHGPAVLDTTKTRVLVRGVATISWPAVLIKLADRIDNLRDSAHALWSPTQRRSFHAQTREILGAVEYRLRSDPPPSGLVESLRLAAQLLRAELRRARSSR